MEPTQLDRIESLLVNIDRTLASKAARPATPATAGAVASDADLDGQYGDPVLKKSPPRWTGRDLASKRYSQLTAEELECLIGFLEWKAAKDDEDGSEEKKKYAGYARKDAARARGWLARVASGRVTAVAPPPVDDFAGADGDDIPFVTASAWLPLPCDRWRGVF